jgi:hypothetical protein
MRRIGVKSRLNRPTKNFYGFKVLAKVRHNSAVQVIATAVVRYSKAAILTLSRKTQILSMTK